MNSANNPHCPTLANGEPFCCFTENDSNSLLAQSGRRTENGNLRISRYERSSVITYALHAKSFDAQPHFAQRVEDAVTEAVCDWNRCLRTFGIQFQRVARESRPFFLIVYRQRDPDPITPHDSTTPTKKFAKSFLPDFPTDKRKLRVYTDALSVSNTYLADIMRHELGHILGLRHDEAAEDEPLNPSFQLTLPSRDSIMTTDLKKDRTAGLHKLDFEAINKLYTLEEGSIRTNKLGSFTVKSINPIPARHHMSRPNHEDDGSVASTGAPSAKAPAAQAPPAQAPLAQTPPAPEQNLANLALVAVSVGMFLFLAVDRKIELVYPW